MLVTIIKVVILLCIIIIPMRGPSRRKEGINRRTETCLERSIYGINEHGDLEEILNEKKEDFF